jgi:hypothetical protein
MIRPAAESTCLRAYRDRSLGTVSRDSPLILDPTQVLFIAGTRLATLGSTCSARRASGSFGQLGMVVCDRWSRRLG